VPLRVVSYEDRPEAMDSLILMGESLCRADAGVSLHLTVPEAPDSVCRWAARRPEVILTTARPGGVSGWDVKAFLLLQELNAGSSEALWLDADIIVTRPVSRLLKEFPGNLLIAAEEWDRVTAADVAHMWDVAPVRAVDPVNSCFVRATADHIPLLERWLQATRHPSYREAQTLPFEQRPWRLAGDQPLLTALLGSAEFCQTPFDRIRMGRHIAQCAGSSGYGPGDRFLDLFRGLPAMIHCIGRKPWELPNDQRPGQFMLDFATDVSPYVLAARKIARHLDMNPMWLESRTVPGSILRNATGYHPGLSGLPLAMAHALYRRLGGSLKP
jgi:hypothetical protein